jgi:hypothetical protein
MRRSSALPSPAVSQPSGQRGHRHVPRQPAWAESPAVRDAPAPRCASTGEGDPGRGQLVRSPGQGQRHPQAWRCRCRRATIASPARPQGSPAGTACAPLACSTEMVMRGRHDTRPTCLCQPHLHLPPWPSTMIPRGWTPCGPCTTQGTANRDAMACTSAAVTTAGDGSGGEGVSQVLIYSPWRMCRRQTRRKRSSSIELTLGALAQHGINTCETPSTYLQL